MILTVVVVLRPSWNLVPVLCIVQCVWYCMVWHCTIVYIHTCRGTPGHRSRLHEEYPNCMSHRWRKVPSGDSHTSQAGPGTMILYRCSSECLHLLARDLLNTPSCSLGDTAIPNEDREAQYAQPESQSREPTPPRRPSRWCFSSPAANSYRVSKYSRGNAEVVLTALQVP